MSNIDVETFSTLVWSKIKDMDRAIERVHVDHIIKIEELERKVTRLKNQIYKVKQPVIYKIKPTKQKRKTNVKTRSKKD